MNGILNSTGLGVFGAPQQRRALGATPSDDVKALQTRANAWLATHGFQALKVDGIMGQKTCGAVRKAGLPVPSNCGGFVEPVPGSFPWNVESADTRALQAALTAAYPMKVDGVLGPVTCGAAKAAGVVVPSTCRSFTMPAGPPAAPVAPQASRSPTPFFQKPPPIHALPVKTPSGPAPVTSTWQRPPPITAVAPRPGASPGADLTDLGPGMTPPVQAAGMSLTTKVALGVGAAAVVGYFVFFRKPTPKGKAA